jgi:hypothetical protein
VSEQLLHAIIELIRCRLLLPITRVSLLRHHIFPLHYAVGDLYFGLLQLVAVGAVWNLIGQETDSEPLIEYLN